MAGRKIRIPKKKVRAKARVKGGPLSKDAATSFLRRYRKKHGLPKDWQPDVVRNARHGEKGELLQSWATQAKAAKKPAKTSQQRAQKSRAQKLEKTAARETLPIHKRTETHLRNTMRTQSTEVKEYAKLTKREAGLKKRVRALNKDKTKLEKIPHSGKPQRKTSNYIERKRAEGQLSDARASKKVLAKKIQKREKYLYKVKNAVKNPDRKAKMVSQETINKVKAANQPKGILKVTKNGKAVKSKVKAKAEGAVESPYTSVEGEVKSTSKFFQQDKNNKAAGGHGIADAVAGKRMAGGKEGFNAHKLGGKGAVEFHKGKKGIKLSKAKPPGGKIRKEYEAFPSVGANKTYLRGTPGPKAVARAKRLEGKIPVDLQARHKATQKAGEKIRENLKRVDKRVNVKKRIRASLKGSTATSKAHGKGPVVKPKKLTKKDILRQEAKSMKLTHKRDPKRLKYYGDKAQKRANKGIKDVKEKGFKKVGLLFPHDVYVGSGKVPKTGTKRQRRIRELKMSIGEKRAKRLFKQHGVDHNQTKIGGVKGLSEEYRSVGLSKGSTKPKPPRTKEQVKKQLKDYTAKREKNRVNEFNERRKVKLKSNKVSERVGASSIEGRVARAKEGIIKAPVKTKAEIRGELYMKNPQKYEHYKQYATSMPTTSLEQYLKNLKAARKNDNNPELIAEIKSTEKLIKLLKR